MTFKVGRTYKDAVGRRWKVLQKRTEPDGTHVMLVRRTWIPFRYEMAFEEEDGKTAIILFDYGFTTIYAEEEE